MVFVGGFVYAGGTIFGAQVRTNCFVILPTAMGRMAKVCATNQECSIYFAELVA